MLDVSFDGIKGGSDHPQLSNYVVFINSCCLELILEFPEGKTASKQINPVLISEQFNLFAPTGRAAVIS